MAQNKPQEVTCFLIQKNLKQKNDVLDIRWGTATIMNIRELQEKGECSYEYATFELLLKNRDMKAARWTKPFPMPEIDYKKMDNRD